MNLDITVSICQFPYGDMNVFKNKSIITKINDFKIFNYYYLFIYLIIIIITRINVYG